MDSILEAAEKKRDEIREELQKITDFIVTYRRLAQQVQADEANTTRTHRDSAEPVDGAASQEARALEKADGAQAKRARVNDNPKPKEVVEAAVKLIREIGRPMTRREIREQLAERGMVVNGADPVKALGTMLWRSGSERLTQIEGRGYWPSDLPLPEATADMF